eukprot:CAMPEP_0171334200 /NCGR_PEP_ID=MMETSP0878-20121228/4514_1 /TAXON_ID=67004 /ORGANISM="Thalassiosira weissflogii, Strain CCMP1336" /LENGTH=173 /DNA_ID=CAMNT_0011835267 /DNA_START=140 /DNA_END=658 /DNA_ORIENTATION=+
MANAAAKKSAVAREAAAKTYMPIISVLDIIYLILRLSKFDTLTKTEAFFTVLLLILSCVSYVCILDAHANNSSVSKKGDPLAGGASLDLLGLVVVVQYGSVLISSKFYWLLLLIPSYGGWKLYSTFFGGSSGVAGMVPQNQPAKGYLESKEGEDSDKAADKRKRRAERRRQKW